MQGTNEQKPAPPVWFWLTLCAFGAIIIAGITNGQEGVTTVCECLVILLVAAGIGAILDYSEAKPAEALKEKFAPKIDPEKLRQLADAQARQREEEKRQREEEKRHRDEEQRRREETERQRREAEELVARAKWREYHEAKSMGDIAKMTGIQFEEFLAGLFARMGYTDISLTGTNDQGGDLLCLSPGGARIVVQAKRWKSSVGNSAVQELLGAMLFYGREEGLVVASSRFTPAACELARRHPRITLRDGRWLSEQIKLFFPPTIPEFNWDEYNRVVKDYQVPRSARRRKFKFGRSKRARGNSTWTARERRTEAVPQNEPKNAPHAVKAQHTAAQKNRVEEQQREKRKQEFAERRRREERQKAEAAIAARKRQELEDRERDRARLTTEATWQEIERRETDRAVLLANRRLWVDRVVAFRAFESRSKKLSMAECVRVVFHDYRQPYPVSAIAQMIARCARVVEKVIAFRVTDQRASALSTGGCVRHVWKEHTDEDADPQLVALLARSVWLAEDEIRTGGRYGDKPSCGCRGIGIHRDEVSPWQENAIRALEGD